MYWRETILTLTFLTSTLYGDCVLCEKIREKNRLTPPPEQEFYEDYLEAQAAEGNELPGAIEFIDDEKGETEKG